MKKRNLFQTLPGIVLAMIFLLTVAAQSAKYRQLDAKDAVVGDWEWVKDPVGNPYTPFGDQQWTYIRLSAGTDLSFGALTYSEDKGYGGLSRFLAWTDGSTITGTLSESSTPSGKGKKISFAFHIEGDQLVITVNGEDYFYKRS